MAPPSPRRSSRARPSNLPSQHSSSSGASGRQERSTRSVNKPSSEKSTPSLSLSSEPLDDFDGTLLSRRRKRGQEDETEQTVQVDATGMANVSDDGQDEEDEAVRCLCGSEEYPGLPPVEGPDAELFASIEITEELMGFFLQCDICKVWQHGACVGIFSAEGSPDEYFCEQCRKDLHKVHTAPNGQLYSKYLPLYRPSQSTSRATSIVRDEKSSSKNSRPSTANASSKRRSTMNSRDAAYDDELLRRAIEASKEDVVHESVETITRRIKRGRSDSEENTGSSAKRQRTGSRSLSPATEKAEVGVGEASENELDTRNGSKRPRSGRGLRDREDKSETERSRQEAANKRKGRADRRRGEGEPRTMRAILKDERILTGAAESDLSEEMPLAAVKAAQNKGAESPNKEESPMSAQPPGTPPATAGSSHKRGGRSNRKAKGRNQYTKNRDHEHDGSPSRSTSRDISKGDEGTSGGKASGGEHRSRAKASGPGKMTMLDMRRRVAAILEFISRTQVDLAAEALPSSSSTSGRDTPQQGESEALANGSADASRVNGDVSAVSDAKVFKELSCMEMMDVLTRDMVKWQNQFA